MSTSEKTIKSAFKSWINHFQIVFNNLNTKFNIKIEKTDLTNDIDVILFIRKEFDENLSQIPESVINGLKEGITNSKMRPEDSLTDTGRALEDFLRISFNSIDMKDCSGLTQISNKLRNNRVISAKHNNILSGLGAIRSMGDAHGLDKDENKSWSINTDTALIYSSFVIKSIKSILDYKNGKLLY